MIQTEYVVLTPAGKFVAQWDENPDKPVTYAGNASAVDYFREFLSIARVTGDGGMAIDPNNLEPSELIGFCQSPEYGVIVLPDAEDSLADADDGSPEALLDSAQTPLEKVIAAKAVAEALAVGGGKVRTISGQRYIDDNIVARKAEEKDFEVQVSPAFPVDGWGLVRVVTDGHHSLAAARLAGVEPEWVEQDERDNDTIALLSRGSQGIDDFLTMHRIDSDFYDIETGHDL